MLEVVRFLFLKLMMLHLPILWDMKYQANVLRKLRQKVITGWVSTVNIELDTKYNTSQHKSLLEGFFNNWTSALKEHFWNFFT